MSGTIIASQLAVDPALTMDANYQFGRSDRRYIDDQIRAIEQLIVDNLINGKHASWFTLSGASDDVVAGDVVCLASVSGYVTKAEDADIAIAGAGLGVVYQAASAGGKVLVAFGGILSPSITGLAEGDAGVIRVTSARLERVDSLADGDFGMGTVDDAGWVQLCPGRTAGAGGSGIAPAEPIAALDIDWSLSAVFTKTLSAGSNTLTFSNAESGATIIVRLTGAASTVTWPTVKWAGGTPPTQTASGTDIYTFVHDGTDIYGTVVPAMA